MDRLRCPGALQVPERGLRITFAVHEAPASAGPDVAREPGERAAAAARRSAPLRVRTRHDFAAHDARESVIALDVLGAKLDRIHTEELLQVVIAHVFEVVARTAVAGDSCLPRWMMRRQMIAFGNIRESKTFGRELHARAFHIRDWPTIRADAVVMRDAGRDVERQRAAPRRRRE